jgi:hypothetical protein
VRVRGAVPKKGRRDARGGPGPVAPFHCPNKAVLSSTHLTLITTPLITSSCSPGKALGRRHYLYGYLYLAGKALPGARPRA